MEQMERRNDQSSRGVRSSICGCSGIMRAHADAVNLAITKCLMRLMLAVAMSSFASNNAYNNYNQNYQGTNGVHCALLQFEQFYSQSFVPNALHIASRVEHNISIYYNATVLQPFPGRILFSIFIRKTGERSQNMLKRKNLDFCKSIESMRNFTTENFHSDTLLQSTFINSCPLTRGFYYIRNGTVNDEVVPLYFTTGHYWLQIELVQVFGEVTKLANVKVKCWYENHW